MSCKPKTFFSVLILITITLHLNSGFCSAKEASRYSGGSSMYRDLNNFADETGSARGLRSSALEYNTTNPNSKHLERASSKNDLSAAFPNRNHNERLPIQTNNYMGKFPWRLNDRLSMHSHDENGSLIRSFHKRAFDSKAGFQGDAAASERPRISGNVYSSKSGSSVPTVHCSGDLMTLTADGREFTHILVDRVNAAPLHLYQLPAYCGITVRVTWKDLVLMAPFDGCYIMQENGSYVLSLLWWGSPIKISCPMTRMMSQPTPSVLCSHFGMLIQIEGAQEAVEKHQVKVNGEVLPLLSETCAYRINSPSDVVILHTTFTSKCVTVMDGENSLVIILDGKQFILSCPFPQHLSPFLPYLHSHPFHQPLQPNVPASLTVTGTTHQPTTASKPETYKPPAVPHFPYEPSLIPQFYPDRIKQPHTPVQDTYPIHPMYPPSIYQHPKVPAHIYSMFPLQRPAPPLKASGFSTDQYPSVPEYQIPQTPVAHTPTAHGNADVEKVPQHQAPVGQYYPVMPPLHYSPYPIFCPPYPETFCSQYPFLYPQYPQTLTTTASQPTIPPMPEIFSSPQTTYMPLNPPVMQNTLFPQVPAFPLVPPKQPPKIQSSSLNCEKNRLTASLPSAKIDSIKVKDMKTDTWFPIASVPAACDYTLRSRGGGVVLSSPLPGCHTEKLSSSVMSLSVRFWDSSLMKTRTLQLQCRYIGDIVGTLSGVSPGTLKPLHQIIPHLTTPPTRQPPKVQVLCSSQHMSVKLPPGPTSGLVVEAPSSGIKTQTKAAHLLEAPDHCGYSLKRNREGVINLLLPYSSCHMIQQDGQHKIILKYQTLDGHTVETLLSCQSSVSQECNVANDQQLVCGSGALSSTECQDKGCCYSADTKLCYYPMDECTVDRHFVFSVYSSIATPPLSPATLVTAGNSSCSPQKVTADFALFKIPLDECGVHRYEVGKTVIYMVEILNRVQSVSLNYGTITRDSPVRLVVECRYFPGSVVSVGYLVKSPSLGPSIKAQGVFGVQLRIAKDEHYNDFHPQYHQPLRMLLGKPLYLEVRLLNPPDPTAILLVHYCVAYPRSAKSAWILIYDGCPNFLDQTPTHKPPATPAEVLTNHVRRFTVTTFQFLPEDDKFQADEEIYFMCSTEVCLPSDGLCVEGCFGDPANVKS